MWKIVHLITRLDLVLMRATSGRRSLASKAPTLVLHHRGRKSGAERTTPLIFLADGDDVVIVASKAGADAHPAWYHNLMAMPTTDVVLPGGERRTVTPRLASDTERADLWPRLVATYPTYDEYRTYTDRTFPILILEPV